MHIQLSLKWFGSPIWYGCKPWYSSCRALSKKEFHDTRMEHSSKIEPICGLHIKLVYKGKHICDAANTCNSPSVD